LREIVKPNGEVYARIKVEEGRFSIQLAQSNISDTWIHMDAKIIPQLRQILTEAEFLKYV
jgi:hypothetical protein